MDDSNQFQRRLKKYFKSDFLFFFAINLSFKTFAVTSLKFSELFDWHLIPEYTHTLPPGVCLLRLLKGNTPQEYSGAGKDLREAP